MAVQGLKSGGVNSAVAKDSSSTSTVQLTRPTKNASSCRDLTRRVAKTSRWKKPHDASCRSSSVWFITLEWAIITAWFTGWFTSGESQRMYEDKIPNCSPLLTNGNLCSISRGLSFHTHVVYTIWLHWIRCPFSTPNKLGYPIIWWIKGVIHMQSIHYLT